MDCCKSLIIFQNAERVGFDNFFSDLVDCVVEWIFWGPYSTILDVLLFYLLKQPLLLFLTVRNFFLCLGQNMSPLNSIMCRPEFCSLEQQFLILGLKKVLGTF